MGVVVLERIIGFAGTEEGVVVEEEDLDVDFDMIIVDLASGRLVDDDDDDDKDDTTPTPRMRDMAPAIPLDKPPPDLGIDFS